MYYSIDFVYPSSSNFECIFKMIFLLYIFIYTYIYFRVKEELQMYNTFSDTFYNISIGNTIEIKYTDSLISPFW